MENNWNLSQSTQTQAGSAVRTFMSNVFSWMFLALCITSVMAYYFASDMELMRTLINPETGGMSILGYVVMFAPLGFVLIMSFGLNKLSSSVMTILFIAFALIMGISLSFIFLVYTATSIYVTFGVAAAMFGLMAVMGYTTKTDLTRMGSLLMMAMIGMIIASLVNYFLKSDTMSYIISFIGVIVFTGLTAYDVQKLKEIGHQVETGSENASKMAIMGALTLYMDFINLFLSLLRLFGNKE